MKKNFDIEGGVATVRISKNIYNKEVIVQATYVLLEEYYFLIDDEKDNYVVTIKAKEKDKVTEKDVFGFFDELIEASSYLDQLKRTSDVRKTILERALLTEQFEDKKE